MRISDDPLHPTRASSAGPAPGTGTVQTVEKTLAILEVVADRGGATAKEVAEALGFPLPTAYRLLHALVHADYLVHLREQKRFELGHKLRALGAMAALPRPTAG
jgi:DNA-binding IclR family transcriptional regulator